MARPKRAPEHIEPEDESQEAPDPEAPREPDSEPATMTKVAAVRAALAEGIESPEEGLDFIRKRFGIEIGRQHFSATKSQLKKREGGGAPKGKRGGRARKAPVAAPAPQPTSAAQPAVTGEPDMLGDLEAVKSLVKKLGAEQVRRIVGLFED